MQIKKRIAVFAGAFLLLAGVPDVRAESAGSKNKDGNRLYAQGKYEAAEKAYFDALANAPGRPEISYNLGNALIRQQKYDQALQALREAEAKGEKPLRADSWYNTGNALFEMNRFKEAVEAYVQALRQRPEDRDAKHNLELAWKRQKEQEQSGGQQDQQEQQQQPAAQEQEQTPRSGDPQTTHGDRRDTEFTREQALQILDALQNQELLEQRKMLERRLKRKPAGKDW